ncbi:CvfB family protein [Geomonas anaerohicana]|uniref:GntR family transcriptional regulator n=1 Tax=Geomonas anaerohicana TaxID=2798583 RepID=A0ABS0YD63_9BACT|nr:S1-like domain-containing RNA-binding protein [Geomonas anaerohicana]MBJ6750253.1 GntR family transcriptional regulator [Geomonas anaerohicana]
MLEIGKYNRLEVKKLSAIGAYLASELGEILLPTKYVPEGLHHGEHLKVFVYLDSEDRLIATTLEPKAQVGDFALMEVKDVSPVGAFLEWGLEKDLLVPFSEQPRPMHKGERHLVRVYLDRSERIAASAKIGKFLEKSAAGLKEGQEVTLTFYEFGNLGAKVIIDGRYDGLLFKTELFGTFGAGDSAKGYIKKIRGDGKIDVTLRTGGKQDLTGGRETLLRVLGERGGFLPVGDKSPPELIAEMFRMSKKNFKAVIGNLYREGVIEITKEGIRLR